MVIFPDVNVNVPLSLTLEAYNSNLVRHDRIKPLISIMINKEFNYDKKNALTEIDFKYPELFLTSNSKATIVPQILILLTEEIFFSFLINE